MRVIVSNILFLFYCAKVIGQSDSTFSYPKLDTLITYDVSLKAETNVTYAKYYVNGEEVRKIIYDSYAKMWDNIGKCTPCYLKTYDIDDNLLREGVQYTDCGVGEFRDYYENGVIKIIGQFKKNQTGSWQQLYNRGYCSSKEGKWVYFDQKGKLEKVEFYKDNQLIR